MSLKKATQDLLHHLARRPGHDEVKAAFAQLLIDEFGARRDEVDFERRVPEIHGRLDALIGRTVFEAKQNLDREWADVERRMPDYLADRERETGESFVGVASDGLKWVVFERDGEALVKRPEKILDPDKGEEFLAWLDGAIALRAELPPDPLNVRIQLGHDSEAWRRANAHSDSGAMTLIDRWNYHNELGAQFPLESLRGVYSKAGTLPAACVVRNDSVIDHKLYWYAASSENEAHYLMAILNSQTARSRVAALQSRGQWGARDFDKVMFTLPIPRYDEKVKLHCEIAMAAHEAERAAAGSGPTRGRQIPACAQAHPRCPG